MLDTVVFLNDKVITFFSNEVHLAKINAEVDTVLAKRFHVSGYPTAVLVNADGTEIDRIVGYADPDEYIKTVDDYRNGIGTLDDLLGKHAAKPDREMAFEIADKYKYRGKAEDAEIWFLSVIEVGEPLDSMSGLSRLAIANMFYRAKEYDRSISAYKQVAKDFSTAWVTEEADVYTAYVTHKMGDTASAIAAYELFLKKHPKSDDAKWAGEQIAKLKGMGTEK
ncbi:MAG: tetratricopeptide repeat protein [Candidatus Zixiibacteriota bacterium]